MVHCISKSLLRIKQYQQITASHASKILVISSPNLAAASIQGLDLRTLFPWKSSKSRPALEWPMRSTKAKRTEIFINSTRV